MKGNAIFRIVIYSVLIVILLGIMGGFVAEEVYLINGAEEIAVEECVDAPYGIIEAGQKITAQVKNIEIEWVAGNIIINTSDAVEDIVFQEYDKSGSGHRLVYQQAGQTLKIKYCEESIKFPSLGINVNYEKDLMITVPSDWECDTLEIDTASANVDLELLTIKEFDFDGASGFCNIQGCDIGGLDIDTASGDVTFTGTLNTLDCDAASANCIITAYNIPREIKMEAASGDLILVLPPDAGFTCVNETMSGSFSSDFEFGTMGAKYICGDGSCQIKISAMSGDVEILRGVVPVENCNH